MDRSEAATILFRWAFEGERELVASAAQEGTDLLAAVDRLARDRPSPPRPRGLPPPPDDFLQLREEREAEALRIRLLRMASGLPPERVQDLERRLAPALQPRGRLSAIRAEIGRLAMVDERRAMQRELEAMVAVPRPRRLTLYLFARDGRLLSQEGDRSRLDLTTVSALVVRGEAGSTWSLAHGSEHLVGHVGDRTALVAVVPQRPGSDLAATLRASVRSLEQHAQILNAPDVPANHAKIAAYLRTVRLLLLRERGLTPKSRG